MLWLPVNRNMYLLSRGVDEQHLDPALSLNFLHSAGVLVMPIIHYVRDHEILNRHVDTYPRERTNQKYHP